MKVFLSSYKLLDKVIAYVKDENENLFTLARTFSFVVKCVPLAIETPWQGTCFGHAFNKPYRYACNDTKIAIGFEKSVSKIDKPSCKKPSLGPRSPTRGTLRGRGFVWISDSPIRNSKIW
jgi:hypothetical protein